ncbi:transcription-repair coupling factor [Roseospira navarrensis]|uniref:Transcription-repair-coupling factor n=1 Tax=Roseospira navarrensis TaxID=140058 RepID=A0A7X1ZBS4_9PROT|nr:transcription-repair coupling factor [Roseospira navarrensis]MQX35623.1 transcription-repair coupling factor [Roseospira navarrensis]
MPEGQDAHVLVALARARKGRPLLHVARDDVRLATLVELARFMAPDLRVLDLPAWDCMPYDRVSPHADILARRIDTLAALAALPPEGPGPEPLLVVTTVNAITQRVPPRDSLAGASFPIRKGESLDMEALLAFLGRTGYVRAEQVMEPGEYAVRGGLVDLFPPGLSDPLRLDLFGDEVDAIRVFDAVSQRTTGDADGVILKPMSELTLDDESIARFRTGYRELFGAPRRDDLLYESVSAGQAMPGMEHWLPLFHAGMDTLLAYLPEAAITLDADTEAARVSRWEQIEEYHAARRDIAQSGSGEGGMIYNPIPPDRLYLTEEDWARMLAAALRVFDLSPYAPAEVAPNTLDMEGRPGRDFADVRARTGENVFEAVATHAADRMAQGKRVALAAYSLGSRDRLGGLIRDHAGQGGGAARLETVESWADLATAPKEALALVALGLDRGFETPDLAVIAEQDVLGDRLARPQKKKRKADSFIQDASTLVEGDLVVHVDHGIGRYDGLETLQVGGAPHDCIRVTYAGEDKLFVPVENIEVLSRYGSETAGVQLDKLGGVGWQARKAKLKNRIRDMADKLIQVAAARHLRKAESYAPPEGLYDEFAARFPYAETDDQLRAIGETIEDLSSGRPMDRLICGDVGFGKTEVALRAAFVAALSGQQVAVVVPTTLLARQHYKVFSERFAGLPVRVGHLSRLVTGKAATATKKELADGTLDIIVGTHALLAKSISFKNLGLLIIDEEQHFGVAHKERLKQLKSDVHVLTLSATPIPRTLQLALTGVREMSLIATPPVDRLAVRTFVLPFDPVVIREAILRERYRGGQCFYVCPRLKDIDEVAERLEALVPEVKVAIAHGQMAARQLEDVMTAFADGQYDILLATNIIESGLDMPRVNTIIIHRADMFGLGQLYQLRGRVGRAKARGYAYLTIRPNRTLSKAAEKRLDVMQTLDTLGAGFTLASHDLDIRGAGNLLGDEQSGHIKEVGIELYQHLLEEAVAAARAGEGMEALDDAWSPQITLGSPILIPEGYVPDLGVRLSLYRRIGDVTADDEIETLAAEMIDRFGPLPTEVENLLKVIRIKVLCRAANAEKIDAGPKGAVIAFRNNDFPNPAGLVQFIGKNTATVKLRPDHKLVAKRDWDDPARRLQGLHRLMKDLAAVAGGAS